MKTDNNIIIIKADKSYIFIILDKQDYYDKIKTYWRIPQIFQINKDSSNQKPTNSSLLLTT